MDFGLVEDYAYMFHKGEIIMNQIQTERSYIFLW